MQVRVERLLPAPVEDAGRGPHRREAFHELVSRAPAKEPVAAMRLAKPDRDTVCHVQLGPRPAARVSADRAGRMTLRRTTAALRPNPAARARCTAATTSPPPAPPLARPPTRRWLLATFHSPILTAGTVTALHPNVPNRHKSHSFHVTIGRPHRRQVSVPRPPGSSTDKCWRGVSAYRGAGRSRRVGMASACSAWARRVGRPGASHRLGGCRPVGTVVSVRRAVPSSGAVRPAGSVCSVCGVTPRRRPRWPAVGRSGRRRRPGGATTSGRGPG